MFPYFRHLQATDPSFGTITKTLSNNITETFSEGLKRKCKLVELNGQKIFKNVSFS